MQRAAAAVHGVSAASRGDVADGRRRRTTSTIVDDTRGRVDWIRIVGPTRASLQLQPLSSAVPEAPLETAPGDEGCSIDKLVLQDLSVADCANPLDVAVDGT